MKRAKCRVFRSSNSFRDWSRSTVKKFNCAGLEKKNGFGCRGTPRVYIRTSSEDGCYEHIPPVKSISAERIFLRFIMEIYPGRGIPMKNFVEHYLLQELLTIKQWSNGTGCKQCTYDLR